MRLAATLIGVTALLLSGCDVEPRTGMNKKELAALVGPDPGTIQSTLKSQAETAENAGDFKRASEIDRQLADKYPEQLEFQVMLSDDLRRAGDGEGALRLTDEVLKKEPQNIGALESKGLTLMTTGEYTEAGNVLGQAMKIDPKRWRTLNAIGILFAMKNLDSEAQAYFNAALQESTDNPRVLNNQALAYAMDHQYDRSIETFLRAKRHVQPGSVELKSLDMNLAIVYAITGRLDEAQQIAAPHLTKEGLYNNMGIYAGLSKNTELAKTYLNMALTQSPVYYERAWKNLGVVGGDDQMAGDDNTEPLPTAAPDQPKRKHKSNAEAKALSLGDSLPQNKDTASGIIPGASDGPGKVPAAGGPAAGGTRVPAASANDAPLLGVPLNDIPEPKKE